MGLNEGQRLGGYQILGAIGAGGMGEVYRATDTTLGREVAIKILPEELARNPERLARFRREAHLLATLNHPHVAAIHGLEEVDGKPFLVLELVPGEDLAQRLKRGPVPVDEALEIAEQIAEALEEAHDNGIVHRDLKPANVKITPEGQVKVLDFGLAKARALTTGEASPSVLSQSPTLATGTQAGVVLGTAAYMSPEQARGKAVDKRADVWAFGVVVYEMLTGRQPFTGETVTDVIAAVVTREPDWGAVPQGTPTTVRRLLERCLRKDPRWRLPDVGAVRLELSEVMAGRAEDAETGEPGGSSAARAISRRAAAWGIGLAAAAVIAAFVLGRLSTRPRSAAPVLAFEVFPPEGTSFRLDPNWPGPVVVSPDGRMLAFTAEADGRSRLYVRPLDETAARALPETDGAMCPFWSPDSRLLGFFAEGRLRAVPVTGAGRPTTLCGASHGRGGSWSPEGVIAFAPDAGSGLYRVSASGGEPAPLTHLDTTRGEDSHRHPRFFPDGRHFLFLARMGGTEHHAVVAGSLDGGDTKEILRSLVAAEYASGHLLFVREGRLMAQPFDPRRLELTGQPFPVAEGIRVVATGPGSTALGIFSASETGVLAYESGAAERRRLVWRDREGRETGQLGDEAYYQSVRLSPRGDRAAVTLSELPNGPADVWIYEIARNLRTRLTFGPENSRVPAWHPDGASVVYSVGQRDTYSYSIHRKTVGGNEPAQILHEGPESAFPGTFSPDGRLLGVTWQGAEGLGDLWILPVEGDREPYPFVSSPFVEFRGMFSPDGRWMAYCSYESGRAEVYVTPFPAAGRRWQVSTDGGSWPEWGQDGKEIFYEAADGMVTAVAIESRGEAPVIRTPQRLFPLEPHSVDLRFAPTPDGQRFLVIEPVEKSGIRPLTVVVNWLARRSAAR